MPVDKAQQLKNDLEYVASTEPGRRVFGHLLRHAGMWTSSYTGQQSSTEFNEGRRSVGLMLYNDLSKYCPKSLLKLLGELQNDVRIPDTKTTDD